MASKKLFYSGIVLIIVSILSALVVPLWGFLQAFNDLRMNETAGIGAVGDSIVNTVIIYICAVFGSLIGIILSTLGWHKMKRESLELS